jgi:hypothetical protein
LVTAVLAISVATVILTRTPHPAPEPAFAPVAASTTAPVTTAATIPTPKDVQPILDAINNRYAAFPTHFRAITMDAGAVLPRRKNTTDTIQHMEIIWVNGQQFLYQGYAPDRALSPNASPAQILDWASQNHPFYQHLQTSSLSYDWHATSGEKPTVYTTSITPGSFTKSSLIPEIQWPMHNWTSNFTLLAPNADTPEACIGLRYQYADNSRSDFFVDPQKDYLCLKQINYTSRDGDFTPSEIFTLTNLRQVAGHWIAGQQIRHDFADPDHNIYEAESITTITYQPLAPSDYPPNLFDPKPLTDNATVIPN